MITKFNECSISGAPKWNYTTMPSDLWLTLFYKGSMEQFSHMVKPVLEKRIPWKVNDNLV